MYYPTKFLREIVSVLNTLMVVASVGIVLLACGFIEFLSRKIAKPLLTMQMQVATNNMALGKYKQVIPVKGNDEITQLGKSIQLLGEQRQYFDDRRMNSWHLFLMSFVLH